MDTEAPYHVPVMLDEAVGALMVRPDGAYADLTFGGGGHSREVLRRLGEGGRLYGFDQDLDAMPAPGTMDERFTFVRSNFRFLANWVRYHGEDGGLDGILADLGVSSHHFDTPERGFSFRFDAPLDMRMNQRARLTAEHVVNDYSEERLADVLYLYGELRNSRQLSALIAKTRSSNRLRTTGQLAEAVGPLLGRDRDKKDLTRIFQALRMEVNGEMKALRQMLGAACQVLRPGGRLVVLTYHSLEDRMVKNMIKAGNPEGRIEADIYGRTSAPLRAVGKMQTPSAQEQALNPRSRSAKLRIAERQ